MVCPKFVPRDIEKHIFGCPSCEKRIKCGLASVPLEDAVSECPSCGRLVVGQYTKHVNEIRCTCKMCNVRWKEAL